MGICGTDSSHVSTVDTGVTPSTTTLQLLEVRYNGSSVDFYIDGANVGNISTNIPATTAVMGTAMTVMTLTTAAKTMRMNTFGGISNVNIA
jgi:hypothetical protein